MRQLISQLGDLQGATVQRLHLPQIRSKGYLVISRTRSEPESELRGQSRPGQNKGPVELPPPFDIGRYLPLVDWRVKDFKV